MVSGNADRISATQFYMSALIVMSVLNAELVFPVCGNICSHFSNLLDKPCTACIVNRSPVRSGFLTPREPQPQPQPVAAAHRYV